MSTAGPASPQITSTAAGAAVTNVGAAASPRPLAFRPARKPVQKRKRVAVVLQQDHALQRRIKRRCPRFRSVDVVFS